MVRVMSGWRDLVYVRQYGPGDFEYGGRKNKAIELKAYNKAGVLHNWGFEQC